MTVHVLQPSLRDTLDRVLEVAAQIDAEGLAVTERANIALSYVIENSDMPWPMALQRQVLSDAIAALQGDARPAATEESGTLPQTAPHEPVRHEPAAPPQQPVAASTVAAASADMMKLANEVVRALSDELDFTALSRLEKADQEKLICNSIRLLSEDRKLHMNGREVADLAAAVLADMLGLGPLEALLGDPQVTDIMVNGPYQVYAERQGKLELTNVRFRDNDHVFAVASRIVAEVGRRIDESQPMVDARLADGSRVNVAVPPLAIDGPTITIRKFPANPVKLDALVEGGSLTSQMAAFLGMAAFLRLNVLISGGTGSGKTTLMNAMSDFIPNGERLVTIEDAAELRLQQPHVVRFETRPPNVEGTGEITMRALMRNALRMRPDRIIIGEIRGDEVLDLLQAMNTGHDGSMSTLHANSPREALTRVESMAALAGFAPGGDVIRRQLSDAVHLIVQVSRMRDGKRRITSISEISGIAGDAITLQDLFTYHADPSSTRAAVKGEFRFSGFRPKFSKRAMEYGVADELDALLGVRA